MKVRYGIVGMGNMGNAHAKYLKDLVKNAILTAVCDIDSTKTAKYKGSDIAVFDNADDLFHSGLVDAVIIATPHYLHPGQSQAAFEAGLHVMCEKPTGVYTKQVRELNAAADRSGKLFSTMFCMRTNPAFKQMKEIVASGALGELKRINWIMTAWYRPQSYYDSGTWRATWAGEGGGILLNQCPHNLDLLLWITGMMPKTVSTNAFFGKWHTIEVEDDVTAFLEYGNGATGVLVASTADTPGTNRLELLGDKGKLVFDGKRLDFYELEQPEREFNATYTGGMGEPKFKKQEFHPASNASTQHAEVLENFAAAIMQREPLYIDGRVGLDECMLANAILLSAWLNQKVKIPFDDELYYAELKKRINGK